MKASTLAIFGLTASFQEPETIKEFDSLAGRPGAALQSAIKNENHRSHGNIRAKVCELLEAEGHGNRLYFLGEVPVTRHTEILEGATEEVVFFKNGKKRLTDEEAKNVTSENDSTMFERILTTSGKNREDFQDLVQRAADLCPFNPQRKERAAAGMKFAGKRNTELATQAYEAGTMKRMATELTKALGREVDVTGEKDIAINQLALAIGENERKLAKQRQADLAALATGAKGSKKAAELVGA